jgi:hypothetical protein
MGYWVIQLWILWETIVLTPLKRTLLAGNIYNFWRITDIDFTRVHIAWKYGYPICFRNFSLYTFVWSCTSFFPDIPVFLFQLSSRSLFGLSNLIKILIQPFLRGWNVKNSTFLSFIFSPNFTKFQVYLSLDVFSMPYIACKFKISFDMSILCNLSYSISQIFAKLLILETRFSTGLFFFEQSSRSYHRMYLYISSFKNNLYLVTLVPSVVPTIQPAVLKGYFHAFLMLIFVQIYQCVMCVCVPKYVITIVVFLGLVL